MFYTIIMAHIAVAFDGGAFISLQLQLSQLFSLLEIPPIELCRTDFTVDVRYLMAVSVLRLIAAVMELSRSC